MKTETVIKRLQKAKCQYDSVIGAIEQKINDKVNFDFFIEHQPSDGFTLVSNSFDAGVAPLDLCLDIIKRNGFLNIENFNKIKI